MNIKDIAQFRTYYRNTFPAKRQDNDFINEHFIGSYNKDKVEGFFAFINGDKKNDEIGSFLKSFLDMAKDTQAIYEFLQNAVDANSSKFYMFYDDEYLMVINDGDEFSYDGVRSILNVGQSTKSKDESTIGKFGIGFKLVHRLVGESSGIEELETGKVGPIILSWYENTNAVNQLLEIKNTNDIIPINQHYGYDDGSETNNQELNSDAPWFFKILLTSFPCQPNDTNVLDINYKKTEEDNLLFSNDEVLTLTTYLKKWIKDEAVIQDLNSKSGSLFFLKLGKGKAALLKDDDLEKGVQISLSILNELTKKNKLEHKDLKEVTINDRSNIRALDLEFEKIVISPEDEDYFKIYPTGKSDKKKVNIEILFGFCKDYKDAVNIIEKYANFYLFFPLSQEAHGFNFIIHCNAFHNGSQRTNLHVKGEDGRNEILFKRFTKELISRLENYKNQEIVNERFYEIYIALLLSKKPKEERNKWLYEPLYQPLENYLKINIPTNQGFAAESKYVKVKNSNLLIQSPKDWGCQEYHWFKWSDKKVDKDIINIVKRGATSYRLDSWSIKELIINTTNLEAINNWLLSLDNDYQLFFSELNDAIVSFKETEEEDEQKFKDNLQKIKLPFENGFYSITEINDKDKNLFLLDNDTIGIQEQLKKLSFKLSSFNLSEYSNLDNFYRKHIKYIADSDLLLEKINKKTSNEELNNGLLSNDKELIIKSLFKKLDKDKRSKLSLFKNKNEIKPSIQLIKNSNATSWLDKFKIQDGYEAITNDLDFTESSNIYHEFIFKLWSEIIVHPDIQIDTDIFYHEVGEYYKHETHHYYQLNKGKELNFIHGTNNQFNKVTEIFYRSELSEIKDYTAITSAIQKLINKPIPSKNILAYISEFNSP